MHLHHRKLSAHASAHVRKSARARTHTHTRALSRASTHPMQTCCFVGGGVGSEGGPPRGGTWFLGVPGPNGFSTLAMGGSEGGEGGMSPGLEALLGFGFDNLSYER